MKSELKVSAFLPHMNLLYAGTLPPHNGGSAILGSELLLGLSRMGHSVRAVAPITDETLLHGDTFAERHPEISVERFRLPYFENSPDLPASADYRRLEEEQMREILPRLIEKRRPDIILIGRETFALHVPDIAVYHSIPTALMIQGATTAGIIRKTVPEDIAQKLLANFHRTDLLIVVARHLAKTMEVLGFNNLKVIENTIDVEKFQPQQKNRSMMADLRISSEDIVVAHLSNLKPLKRPLDLLESAIPALKQNPRLLFLIVGDGLLRNKMEQFCRQNHLEERVRFTGWIEHDQIPLIMNLADITVMPSESEARALVYLEAQACGRVLIASDIAAAREAVLDGETGFLFQTGNIPDLTRKLLSAAADSNLRAEIGRKAREAVLARPFSVLVNEYECAFRKLIRQYKSHAALV